MAQKIQISLQQQDLDMYHEEATVALWTLQLSYWSILKFEFLRTDMTTKRDFSTWHFFKNVAVLFLFFEKLFMFGLTSNVLSLHFVFSSRQNSNVDNFLLDLHNPFEILSKILKTLFYKLDSMSPNEKNIFLNLALLYECCN